MTLKRKEKSEDVVNKTLEDVLDSLSPELIDPTLAAQSVDSEEDDVNPTMTSVSAEFSSGRGMTPAHQIKAKDSNEFVDTKDINNSTRKGKPTQKAKPASEIDLSNLDESMIMEMPEIKAASFEIVGMLDLKPKDKTLRFRWANCKNHVAGNLARYLAIGYEVASIDDVDIDQTKVDPSMVEGTQVRYFDILLLKIPVMRLMSLYKKNIIGSVNRIATARQAGLKEAKRQFENDINTTGQAGEYESAKAKLGGVDPVQFYTPGVQESEVINR